ncbi:hypothetical protein H072_3052 [Dactylellina haptotyla CBS 200.50]|uniref:WSC domain-containing protein n=1 Tax=Dactylellina haptotyla (strain CBS 200.50) TaxID=1284197 RepID=S8AP97_DACHA|nr:hypothetical protein H072_3052 [Dactylellina haptotyla CBS 200.50]
MLFSIVAIAAVALNGVLAVPVENPNWPGELLKRQAPGTPLYNCHDNCGQAVAGSRKTGYCSSIAFIHNYANCIQCSGPDNNNIWHYYSSTLIPAGSGCGFPTTPDTGVQPAVDPAIPDGGVWP